MITLRFFAGARAAMGRDTLELDHSSALTLADALANALEAAPARTRVAAASGPDVERVLSRCSFLVDGLSTTDPATMLDDGIVVDVLPPFAGG